MIIHPNTIYHGIPQNYFFLGMTQTKHYAPKCISEWPQYLCSRSRFTNNNNEQNATKFTIGTSDEDDSNDDEVARDLEKLFCPLTENNGAQHDIDLGYQGMY